MGDWAFNFMICKFYLIPYWLDQMWVQPKGSHIEIMGFHIENINKMTDGIYVKLKMQVILLKRKK